MITLVPENYLLIQPNVYFTEKETDPMNQLHSSSHNKFGSEPESPVYSSAPC